MDPWHLCGPTATFPRPARPRTQHLPLDEPSYMCVRWRVTAPRCCATHPGSLSRCYPVPRRVSGCVTLSSRTHCFSCRADMPAYPPESPVAPEDAPFSFAALNRPLMMEQSPWSPVLFAYPTAQPPRASQQPAMGVQLLQQGYHGRVSLERRAFGRDAIRHVPTTPVRPARGTAGIPPVEKTPAPSECGGDTLHCLLLRIALVGPGARARFLDKFQPQLSSCLPPQVVWQRHSHRHSVSQALLLAETDARLPARKCLRGLPRQWSARIRLTASVCGASRGTTIPPTACGASPHSPPTGSAPT